MDFDVIIVGGGAAGMSCALILGSAMNNSYAENKNVGIILHQKTSDLQNALFNNVLGLPTGTKGEVLLKDAPKQLKELYPKVVQVPKEKVLSVIPELSGYNVKTNKNSYLSNKVEIATGYSKMLKIKGLETYIIPHKKSPAGKNRIQLKNEDHLVAPNLYVAGTLAGHRSQFAIACGSGAAVATDILTDWNMGRHTKVHDKLK
jgi:thioredoxin reductase